MSPKKKANSAKTQSTGQPAPSRDSIAIIGIGCRYPGVSNPEELWQAMVSGRDLIGTYPGGRFAELDRMFAGAGASASVKTDRGGFLADVAGFDSQFFGISPRESIYIDPQHRLLLEVAWEALEDAGLVRESYQGSSTGVYTGLWTSEYENRLYESASENDFYSVTGCGRASASGRLSFTFGMQGPSITIDTACSSSLVAVHMACEALRSGEIEMALAGGANLILGPEICELFTKTKMLSPDGRCKFGDASADGFVRSEGAGIVVLKRLSRALADKDPIYALIRGSAINNDGSTSGFLTPSREGQQQMLRAAWKAADVDPRDILYMEMHGTGTSVGDPVEIGAVGGALDEVGVDRPCLLGSVKTNLGHTESASGVTGLIKAALVLQHRFVPASLHFNQPNPKIEWDRLPVRIASEPVDLAAAESPALAGVNSFGLSGTNAHVVLEEAAPARPEKSGQSGPWLLPISAQTPEALQAMMRAYLAEMESAGPEFPIRGVCFTAGARRTQHTHRVGIVGDSAADVAATLAAALAGEESDRAIFGRADGEKNKIVFVAPGQGSQWLGMARELYDREPVFRQAFEECDSAVAAETGWRLADRVLGPDAERYLTHIDVIQPSLFAMSVALAAVWRGWGIEPDAVVGHSMGEVAAAHIAGILNLKDAVAVICRRSRLMKTLRSAGSMATVELPLAEVEKMIASRPGVSIGASNGPHTTVISGDSNAIELLLKEFEAREVYCRQIKVDVASHSAQVDPILDELFRSLQGIRPQPAKIPMLSTVTGEVACSGDRVGAVMDAAYWVQNLRRSVLFAPAIQNLARDGHDTFVELSPHPILLPSIEASAREVVPGALAVASLRREKPEQATLLSGLAAFYAAGRTISWERLYPEGARCVRLPQYPFQRERCWPEPADPSRSRAALRTGDASPLLGHTFESSLQPGTIVWETEMAIADLPWLNDHRVLRSAVFPASGHIDMALCAAKALHPEDTFEVRNASFVRAAYLPDQGGKTFQIALTPDTNGAIAYDIRTRADEGESEAWPVRSSGILHRAEAASIAERIDIADIQTRYATRRDAADHYSRTARSGLQYGPAFQRVQEAWVGDAESLCRLQGTQYQSQSILHATLLDACFQAITHVRPEDGGFDIADTYLPVSIERIRVARALPNEGDLFAQATLVGADATKGMLRADLRLADAEGKVLVEVTGMQLMRVARESASAAVDPLYAMDWVAESSGQNAHATAEATVALLPSISQANWIVFADHSGIADAMQSSLAAAGGRCTLIRPGAAFRQIGESEFEVNPGAPQDLTRLFKDIAADRGVPTAVVHLWSLGTTGQPGGKTGHPGVERDGLQPVRQPLHFPGALAPEGVPTQSDEGGPASEKLMQAQALGCRHIPGVVQAIAAANWENPPRLWLVTAGAMPVEANESPRIASAPMWGVGRAVAREHAELRTTLVDLSGAPTPAEGRALALRICAGGIEDRIALRGGSSYVARLKPVAEAARESQAEKLADGEQYRVEIPAPGILDNLELRAYACPEPGPGEVVIEVAAAGLNFIDVTKVMGIYPGLDPADPIQLGIECAGRVTSVGEGVAEFHTGDEVLAITPSMRTTALMASSVRLPAAMVFRKPARLSVEEAATIPIAYLTAYYSLVELARIRRGDWVLIQAAAGGVGLAAIEIAKWTGANIIATAGSSAKTDYLRSIGITHILNSRSLDFAAGVMEITEGRGVDVVLNSLTGEFISKGLEVLAPYGRFVELGKRDIYDNRNVGLKVFRKNLSFHAVDLAAAIEERPGYIVELLREIMRHIESGEWKPLPVTSFSSADPSEPFRFMAQARHIGKIAVRMERDVNVLPARNKPLFSSEATYLITGGLGGVALTLAEWMAKNGAGHLVLMSRRAPSEEHAGPIRRMEAAGATVVTVRADVTRASDVDAALERIRSTMPPLKGILHTAAVVDDALITDLSPERFLTVMGPKITGTWNLHTATLDDPLEFFVLFSSIAAIHPQPGMGSYASANAFMDAFAHHRRAQGLPAISINWGGWDQIGLARAAGTGRSIEGYEREGMKTFSGAEGAEFLRRALAADRPQVMANAVDWETLAEFYGPKNIPPAFSALVSDNRARVAAPSNRSETIEQLAGADSAAERREILEAHLQEVLGRVLKLASHRIDRDRPLGSMGLDSLMGLEFVRRLSNTLEIAVPATVVFNYPTIKLLAPHLLHRLGMEQVPNEAKKSTTLHSLNGHAPKDLSGALPDLSEDEALQALIGEGAGNS